MARFQRARRAFSSARAGASRAIGKAKKAASSARRRATNMKKKNKILTLVAVAAVGAAAYMKFKK